MFDALEPKPADPLLKLIQQFRDDPRADKIDLGVGVYRDENGETPVMAAVKQAERRLIENQRTKTYVGQRGDADYLRLHGELAFGPLASEMAAFQTVGGTGALRLGCELLRVGGAKRMLLPAPSWPNHPSLIRAAGLAQADVPFFDVAKQQIDIDRLVDAFSTIERGDGVLLQGCCHNPLGADFNAEHWRALADAVNASGVVPFVDVAYQGFGDGIDEDMTHVRAFLEAVPEALIAVSAAKSFGIYRERVGALFVKTSAQGRAAATSNLAAITRADYSMPPDHGAACVREVLGDADLRASWRAELDAIRAHIKKTRAALADARAGSIPMQLIAAQKGMFSTLPLSPAQIDALRDTHGIYMSGAGRINVAGLREADIPRFVEALQSVTA